MFNCCVICYTHVKYPKQEQNKSELKKKVGRDILICVSRKSRLKKFEMHWSRQLNASCRRDHNYYTNIFKCWYFSTSAALCSEFQVVILIANQCCSY